VWGGGDLRADPGNPRRDLIPLQELELVSVKEIRAALLQPRIKHTTNSFKADVLLWKLESAFPKELTLVSEAVSMDETHELMCTCCLCV